MKDIETENNNNLDTEPNLITRDELDMAIRQPNKGKSVGPDDIPNEAIIQGWGQVHRVRAPFHGSNIRLYKTKIMTKNKTS